MKNLSTLKNFIHLDIFTNSVSIYCVAGIRRTIKTEFTVYWEVSMRKLLVAVYF